MLIWPRVQLTLGLSTRKSAVSSHLLPEMPSAQPSGLKSLSGRLHLNTVVLCRPTYDEPEDAPSDE